jgi:hypothetical protein
VNVYSRNKCRPWNTRTHSITDDSPSAKNTAIPLAFGSKGIATVNIPSWDENPPTEKGYIATVALRQQTEIWAESCHVSSLGLPQNSALFHFFFTAVNNCHAANRVAWKKDVRTFEDSGARPARWIRVAAEMSPPPVFRQEQATFGTGSCSKSRQPFRRVASIGSELQLVRFVSTATPGSVWRACSQPINRCSRTCAYCRHLDTTHQLDLMDNI